MASNIRNTDSANFKLDDARKNKTDKGLPVQLKDCVTKVCAAWANDVDEKLEQVNEAFVDGSPIKALTIGDGTDSPEISLDKVTTGTASVAFNDAGTVRWRVSCDANEDLNFDRYDSNGASVGTPLKLEAATGDLVEDGADAPRIGRDAANYFAIRNKHSDITLGTTGDPRLYINYAGGQDGDGSEIFVGAPLSGSPPGKPQMFRVYGSYDYAGGALILLDGKGTGVQAEATAMHWWAPDATASPAPHQMWFNSNATGLAFAQDSKKLFFGAGMDGSITFDGSNLIIDPDPVTTTAACVIDGPLQVAAAASPQTDGGSDLGADVQRWGKGYINQLLVGGADPSDAPSTEDDVVVGDGAVANAGMTVFTSTTGIGRLTFTDTAGARVGGNIYLHSSNSLQLAAGGSGRVELNNATDFSPVSGQTIDLGKTADRWANGYLDALHLAGASSGDAPGVANDLVIGDGLAGSYGMTIYTTNTGSGRIAFTDTAATEAGTLRYTHAAAAFEWAVEGSYELRLAASDLGPINDGGLNLGTATKRWKHAYVDQFVSQEHAPTVSGTAHTVDFDNGQHQVVDLQGASGTVALTLSNPQDGCRYMVRFVQGSTVRDVTWPGGVVWEDGLGAPALSEVDDGVSIVELEYLGSNYYGRQVWPRRMRPVVVRPQEMVPDASAGATLATRNNHKVMAFSSSAVEAAYVEGVMPRDYAGGGLTVKIWFAGNGDNGGAAGVTWRCSVEDLAAAGFDLDADGFAASQEVDTAGPPATSGQVSTAEITFTEGAQMDSLQAGAAFRLKIDRNVNDTNDTYGQDAQIVRVEIREG